MRYKVLNNFPEEILSNFKRYYTQIANSRSLCQEEYSFIVSTITKEMSSQMSGIPIDYYAGQSQFIETPPMINNGKVFYPHADEKHQFDYAINMPIEIDEPEKMHLVVGKYQNINKYERLKGENPHTYYNYDPASDEYSPTVQMRRGSSHFAYEGYEDQYELIPFTKTTIINLRVPHSWENASVDKTRVIGTIRLRIDLDPNKFVDLVKDWM